MAQQGLALFARDRNRIAQRGARAGNAGLVFGQFARRVLVGVPQVQSLQSLLALSAPTILTAIRTLQDMEIVNELTGQRRHRVSLISVTSKSSAKARSRCEPCPGRPEQF